jgi:hypothetical protein
MKIKGCSNSKWNSYDLPASGKEIPLTQMSSPTLKEMNKCMGIDQMMAKEKAKFEAQRYTW